MQEECDAIYPATLYSIMHGRDAKRYLDNSETPYAGIVYGPVSDDHHGKPMYHNSVITITINNYNKQSSHLK